MFVKALAGLSLIISASINPGTIAPESEGSLVHLPARQKSAVIRPLVEDATDCVARAVAADPRLGKSDVTDLIVDSFRHCTEPVRALIDAHDRYYGVGTGELFFMGPYLDALPETVIGIVKSKTVD